MSDRGFVSGIYITQEKSTPLYEVNRVEAVEGLGLKGDRNYIQQLQSTPEERRPENELTLIELESVEYLNREFDMGTFSPGDLRRNIITKNVSLNDLTGKKFKIGEVEAEGIELCEPCRHLEKLTGKPVMKPLVHKAGLRARILKGGIISKGDEILVEMLPRTLF